MPIGISNFKEIIENNYYYIDKTLLIKEILDDGSKVILLTRPRRFGKTINISMLKYFFEKSEEDKSYLFKGLKIFSQNNVYTKNQGKYPVIFITLKDIKNSNWEMTYNKIKKCIEEEYDRFALLANSECLTEIEKETFNKIRTGIASESDYENSLKYLTEYLDKHFGVAPILLLDEYDVPIQSGYTNGFYDKIIEFIRNWLSGAVKDNNHISFSIMTGILRIGKESIFSGMNNLKVRTILDNQYSEYFGFTEDEIIEMLKYYGREEELETVKEWYDGYIFGKTEIYNPWSIINYIDNKGSAPQAYWLNTSSNDVIHDVIKNSNINIQKNIIKLMEGSSIEEIIDTNIIYLDIYKDDNYLFSLLLLSGYLKAMDTIQNEFGFTVAKLAIPNKEIKIAYRQEIMIQISKGINTMEQIKMVNALVSGDVFTFEKIFTSFLIKTTSFHDSSESFYHGLMLGITTLLIDKYMIKSNRESGFGRFDLVLIPREKEKVAIIMEFKKANTKEELRYKEFKNEIK
ncbi:AAA family ATPase [Clostridium acetireducens]|nr:AAA family ATPase [Clostridium acetireducens]